MYHKSPLPVFTFLLVFLATQAIAAPLESSAIRQVIIEGPSSTVASPTSEVNDRSGFRWTNSRSSTIHDGDIVRTDEEYEQVLDRLFQEYRDGPNQSNSDVSRNPSSLAPSSSTRDRFQTQFSTSSYETRSSRSVQPHISPSSERPMVIGDYVDDSLSLEEINRLIGSINATTPNQLDVSETFENLAEQSTLASSINSTDSSSEESATTEEDEEEEGEICPICQEPLGSDVTDLQCHHKMHVNCYREYFFTHGVSIAID